MKGEVWGEGERLSEGGGESASARVQIGMRHCSGGRHACQGKFRPVVKSAWEGRETESERVVAGPSRRSGNRDSSLALLRILAPKLGSQLVCDPDLGSCLLAHRAPPLRES